MPDTKRTQLLTPPPSPKGMLASGSTATLLGCFGMPFIAAGVFIALLGTRQVTARGSSDAPPWLLGVLGAVFFLAGAAVSSSGIIGFWRQRRTSTLAQRHPGEPWRVEYAWDRRGSHGHHPSLLGQFAMAGFLSLFLAPFNWFVFLAPTRDAPFFAYLVIGFFDLLPLLVLAGIVYTLIQRAKYRGSFLAFGDFPLFLGGPVQLQFSTRSGIGRFNRMSFVLRCIEEHTQTRRSGSRTTTETRFEQVWADTWTVDEAGRFDSGVYTLTFDLPQGEYGTQLLKEPARFWALEVKADTPGVDFCETFLVPIYGRSF